MTKPHDLLERNGTLVDGALAWRPVLHVARALAAVVVASGLLSAASSAVFVASSTPSRGHVVSWATENTDHPVDSREGLHFLPVTISKVKIAYIERDGRTSSAFVPESACWRVNEADVPIRHDSATPPHIRVDTLNGLWGEAAVKLLLGAALFALVELRLR